MQIILDTDHVGLLEWEDRPDSQRLRARLAEHDEGNVATTIVSYEEQMRGWLAFMAKRRTIEHQVEAYYRLKRHLGNYCDIIVLSSTKWPPQSFNNCVRIASESALRT